MHQRSSKTDPRNPPSAPSARHNFTPGSIPLGLITRATLERTHPRLATGPAARRLLTLIDQLGAVSLDTAVHIAYLADCRPFSASYRAGQALVRARLAASLPVTRLGLGRAPGLGRILIPGPEWPFRAHEFGVRANPCITHHHGAAAISEHLILGAEIIRRRLDGWQLILDETWVIAAAHAIKSRGPSDRLRLAQRALSSGILQIPSDAQLIGLMPPGNTRLLPAVVLHSDAVPAVVRRRLLRMLDHLAPLELIMWNRSDNYTRHVRRLLDRTSELTVLPRGRGHRWRRFWGEIYSTVRRDDDVSRDRAMQVLVSTTFHQLGAAP